VRISWPTRKRIVPLTIMPTCSFSWLCSGMKLSASSSTTASRSSPCTARASTPSQIRTGDSPAMSAKGLTRSRTRRSV
jgi:hypothetical protein